MRMKKLFLLSFFALVLPVSLFAQDDDMYFVPTKKNVEKAKKDYGMPRDTYYSGSNRSVDEYNRRYVNSTVTAIDSLGNVIPTEGGDDRIELDGVTGVYPDSLEDFSCTRKMSRWDDYEWRDGYNAGYSDGRWGRWGWSSPYYYSGWYGGWYDPWFYDPWYYGGWGYGGWYNPWHYGWGWGYPHYWHNHYWGGWYPGGGITVARRSYGTNNHSVTNKNHSGYNYRRYNSIGNNRGNIDNNRYGNINNTTNRNINFGGARNSNGNTYQNNSSFGGTRNNGGGSFSNGGGNRGGGGSFGGGNRGGGGRFGGGRR